MTQKNKDSTFALDLVSTEKDCLRFPIKLVDISKPVTVTLPEEHIGIRQGASPDEVLKSMSESGIWNVVQFSQENLGQRLNLACQIIQNPKAFLESPSDHMFGVSNQKEAYLKTISERRWTFRASTQKNYILDMINNYLRNVPGAKPIAETVYFIADELITNALYNAPFGDSDYSLDRSTVVLLNPKLSSEIVISHNINRLLIGCLDQFGSFDCEEFISRTSKSFAIRAEDISKVGVGGAGIGMMRIIDLAAELIVVVEKNKRTFVGCSFPLNKSLRKVREASRNFFFQSFENYQSDTINLRVERRGSRVLIRCSGTFDNQTPLKELNLIGTSEISVDMRLIRGIEGNDFDLFFASLKSLKDLGKIFFDYVPQAVLSRINALTKVDPQLFEVRSLSQTNQCKTCKMPQSLLLKTTSNPQDPNDPLKCPACGNPVSV